MSLRSLLTSLLEDEGDEVIAESDNAREVLELVRRFQPDVLLLDHALRSGTGLSVVAAIEADPELSCHIVLFSSFVEASQVQQNANVTAVDKPDFARLQVVLEEIRAAGSHGGAIDRRRPPSRLIDQVHGQGDDDDPLKFFAVLGEAQAGDTLLLLSVDDPTVDVLAAIAAEGRATIRAQDWLVLRSRFVATLLVGGSVEAGPLVAERVLRALTTTSHAGCELRVASAVLGPDDVPSDVFQRLAAEVS